jgi:hypothetical protein
MTKSRYVKTSYLANAIIGKYGTVSPNKTFEIVDSNLNEILVKNKVGLDNNIYKIVVKDGSVANLKSLLTEDNYLPIDLLSNNTIQNSNIELNDYSIEMSFLCRKQSYSLNIEALTKEFI